MAFWVKISRGMNDGEQETRKLKEQVCSSFLVLQLVSTDQGIPEQAFNHVIAHHAT